MKASQTDGKQGKIIMVILSNNTWCESESDYWQKGKIWLYCQTTLGVNASQTDGKKGRYSYIYCHTTLGVKAS